MIMEASVTRVDDQMTELTLPGGCLVCEGEVKLRISPAGARLVCRKCAWIFQSEVHLGPEGLRIDYRVAGQA